MTLQKTPWRYLNKVIEYGLVTATSPMLERYKPGRGIAENIHSKKVVTTSLWIFSGQGFALARFFFMAVPPGFTSILKNLFRKSNQLISCSLMYLLQRIKMDFFRRGLEFLRLASLNMSGTIISRSMTYKKPITSMTTRLASSERFEIVSLSTITKAKRHKAYGKKPCAKGMGFFFLYPFFRALRSFMTNSPDSSGRTTAYGHNNSAVQSQLPAEACKKSCQTNFSFAEYFGWIRHTHQYMAKKARGMLTILNTSCKKCRMIIVKSPMSFEIPPLKTLSSMSKTATDSAHPYINCKRFFRLWAMLLCFASFSRFISNSNHQVENHPSTKLSIDIISCFNSHFYSQKQTRKEMQC